MVMAGADHVVMVESSLSLPFFCHQIIVAYAHDGLSHANDQENAVTSRNIGVLPAAGVVALSLVLVTSALAGKRDRSPVEASERISWTQLVTKLEGQGYDIRELDMKRDGWKAEVVRDGGHYELRLDRQGNVVRMKMDD